MLRLAATDTTIACAGGHTHAVAKACAVGRLACRGCLPSARLRRQPTARRRTGTARQAPRRRRRTSFRFGTARAQRERIADEAVAAARQPHLPAYEAGDRILARWRRAFL